MGAQGRLVIEHLTRLVPTEDELQVLPVGTYISHNTLHSVVIDKGVTADQDCNRVERNRALLATYERTCCEASEGGGWGLHVNEPQVEVPGERTSLAVITEATPGPEAGALIK